MNRTPIEWCRTYSADGTFVEGHTVNPVRFRPHGSERTVTMCQKVSPGCAHCYAEGITRRFWPKDAKARAANDASMGAELVGISFPGYTAQGVASGEFELDEEMLLQVLKRRKPTRIFWGDMTDLFQESVPDASLHRILAVCALTPHLTHMFLTKRPQRMQKLMRQMQSWNTEGLWNYFVIDHFSHLGVASEVLCGMRDSGMIAWPLPNVWLGVSTENQATADERIPLLLETPAAVRFISAEPLLGPIDLEAVPLPDSYLRMIGVDGVAQPLDEREKEPDDYRYFTRKGFKLDWVIAGGESGSGARPMHPDWARTLRDQCAAASVPFFFKQWGEWVDGGRPPLVDCDHLSALDGTGASWALSIKEGKVSHLGPSATGWTLDQSEFPRHDLAVMQRAGKKAAGALLDGVEHRAFPEVRVG